MKAEYVLQNFRIYEKNHGRDSEELKGIMNSISTEYIRIYRNGGNTFEEVSERKVLNEMINYFEDTDMYMRCAQLVKIRDGQQLGSLNTIVPE